MTFYFLFPAPHIWHLSGRSRIAQLYHLGKACIAKTKTLIVLNHVLSWTLMVTLQYIKILYASYFKWGLGRARNTPRTMTNIPLPATQWTVKNGKMKKKNQRVFGIALKSYHYRTNTVSHCYFNHYRTLSNARNKSNFPHAARKKDSRKAVFESKLGSDFINLTNPNQ